jgi:hypothetical protein
LSESDAQRTRSRGCPRIQDEEGLDVKIGGYRYQRVVGRGVNAGRKPHIFWRAKIAHLLFNFDS